MKSCFTLLLALAVAEPAASNRPTPSPSSTAASSLLVGENAFSPADMRAVSGGQVVAKVLDSPDRSEIVTLAAVGVRVDAASFRACAAEPSCLYGHDEVKVTGRFSATPRPEDLGQLEVDSGDRDHLARCRVGRCGVRLPASAIERFRRSVAWRDPAAAAQAATVFRGTVASLALDYVDQGDQGLPAYDDDGTRTVRVADALGLLLGRPFFLLDLAPELRQHLSGEPPRALVDGTDYLCWRQERFWRQTLTSLEHVAIQTSSAGIVLAAVKQLYASHYFDGSLALFAFVPDPASGRGTLVHVSRARADIRPSGFTWWERVFLKRMVRGRLERHLGALRERLEMAPS